MLQEQNKVSRIISYTQHTVHVTLFFPTTVVAWRQGGAKQDRGLSARHRRNDKGATQVVNDLNTPLVADL
jgi:hypothetical protein